MHFDLRPFFVAFDDRTDVLLTVPFGDSDLQHLSRNGERGHGKAHLSRDVAGQAQILVHERGGEVGEGSTAVGPHRRSGGGTASDEALRQLQSRVKSAFDPLGILNPGLIPGAGL